MIGPECFGSALIEIPWLFKLNRVREKRTMKPKMTILEVMQDDQLLGKWFRPRFFRGDSFRNWKTFLKATFALPMDADDLAIYKKFTGRRFASGVAPSEAWMIVGRSGGKSLIAAAISTYIAVFLEHPSLVPGETACCMSLAVDKAQAKIVADYQRAFFNKIPLLKKLEVNRTAESLLLRNGVTIETHAADFGSLRGRSFLCVTIDEIAFLSTDVSSKSPDVEILNSVRPGLARVPNSKLVCLSSPYGERGELYNAYRLHYGRDESLDTLVWMAPSSEMNPTLSEEKIAAAIAADPERASAEYGFGFRSDLDNFLTREAVGACVDRGVAERSCAQAIEYRAFVDASGGRSDSFVLAIAHHESEKAVLDLLKEIQAPFSPSEAVAQLFPEVARFGIHEVTGDNYGAQLIVDLFNQRGIGFRQSELNRTELYLELGAAIRSRQVVLLDLPKLTNQLVGLRLRTGISGKDSIDHVGGAHDDCANACAGALLFARGGGALGVLDYYNSGQAARDLAELENPSRISLAQDRVAQLVAPLGERGEQTISGCSHCGAASSLQSVIAGGQIRCAQCGIQTWPGGVAPFVYRGPSRSGM
jgi:hypothetical protein